MGALRDSLCCIAIISLLYGVFKTLCSNERLKKYTDYALALIFITTLISPVKALIDFDYGNIKSYFGDYSLPEDNKHGSYTDAIEKALKDNISTRLAIPSDAYEISIIITEINNELIIEKIQLTVTDKEYFKYADRLQSYLKTELGCEISVMQKGG